MYFLNNNRIVFEKCQQHTFVPVQVKNGKNIKILYGKAKKPVAMITPIGSTNSPRKIGILDGKTTIEFRDDFAITPEELVAIQ
jgi:hypothetical protein